MNSTNRLAVGLAAAAMFIALLGNFAVADVSHKNCLNIEDLKTRVRARAIDEHNKLDENGKLLGIKITPELREASKQGMLETLEKYKAESCSIIP